MPKTKQRTAQYVDINSKAFEKKVHILISKHLSQKKENKEDEKWLKLYKKAKAIFYPHASRVSQDENLNHQ